MTWNEFTNTWYKTPKTPKTGICTAEWIIDDTIIFSTDFEESLNSCNIIESFDSKSYKIIDPDSEGSIKISNKK